MDAGIRGGASGLALLALLALSLLAMACGDDLALSGAEGELAVAATEVTFPPTFVGFPSRESLGLSNTGRATISVELSLTGPFGAERTRVELSGGELFPLPLAFSPLAPGFASGTLLVALDGVVTEVALRGVGVNPPGCSTDNPCARSSFNPRSGLCTTIAAPPFSPCSSGNLCQQNELCRNGACVGSAIDCDDSDICTADACDASSGCTHRDDSGNCPGSSDPCRVPACDATEGCGLVDARDGTVCGAADCATAHVCILGSCREVETPEGTPCTATCGPGKCLIGSCLRQEGDVLDELFRVEATPGREVAFGGVADADGDLFFRECWSGGCSLVSVAPDGVLRFRAELGPFSLASQPLLVAGDRLWHATGPVVMGLDRDDGSSLVEADLSELLPQGLGNGCPGCVGEVVALADAGADGIAAAVAIQGLPATDARGTLALISARGAVTLAVPLEGQLGAGSLVAGADGTLFLGLTRLVDAKPLGELVAIDRQGRELWRRQLPQKDLPLSLSATAEGVVILASGHALRTGDGADAYRLPLPPGAPGRSPLLAPGLGYWLALAPDAPLLHAFEPTSGARIANLELDALPGQRSDGYSEPLLTAGGTALLLATPGDPALPPELLELVPGPGALRRCELPVSGTADRGMRLLGERLVLHVLGRDGSSSLRAYRLPGADAAPSGWTGPGGSLGGGRRPE